MVHNFVDELRLASAPLVRCRVVSVELAAGAMRFRIALCKVSRRTLEQRPRALCELHGRALQQRQSCQLQHLHVSAGALLLQFDLPATVHFHGIRADEGFVAFDFTSGAAHLCWGTVSHSFTNPMQHEPCGLLGNFQVAVQLPRANPILAVADHPDRDHPLVESKSGVLKDRADFERELLWQT